MATNDLRTFAVAESCGMPLTIVDALDPRAVVAMATGSEHEKAPDASLGNWVVAEVTPQQRLEVESLPAESVISYLLSLPRSHWRL